MEKKIIPFNNLYKIFNLTSSILILISILLLFFKGLNFGVDFKGGTLIEIRTSNNSISISDLRKSFNKMNLGDISVKEFGTKNDFIVKFEKKINDKENTIDNIKKDLSSLIGNSFEYR